MFTKEEKYSVVLASAVTTAVILALLLPRRLKKFSVLGLLLVVAVGVVVTEKHNKW